MLNMTVWPSGLRRWLQAPVRKGVGSNPTAVNISALLLEMDANPPEKHVLLFAVGLPELKPNPQKRGADNNNVNNNFRERPALNRHAQESHTPARAHPSL